MEMDIDMLTIIPMVEIDVEYSLPENTLASTLIREIKSQTDIKRVIAIPGGFCVALNFLSDRISGFADYLFYEVMHYPSLEMTGGFNIITNEGEALGIPLGSTFSLAMLLADGVRDIVDNNNPDRLYTSSQDFWEVEKIDSENLMIRVGKISKRVIGEYIFPTNELITKL